MTSLRKPGDDVLAFGEVQERGCRWPGDAVRIRHRIHLDAGLGGLQRPWWMVDFKSSYAAGAIDRIQTVPFGHEMLQRTRRWMEHGADRSISPLEAGSTRGTPTPALVIEPPTFCSKRHRRSVVRKIEHRPSRGDRE